MIQIILREIGQAAIEVNRSMCKYVKSLATFQATYKQYWVVTQDIGAQLNPIGLLNRTALL